MVLSALVVDQCEIAHSLASENNSGKCRNKCDYKEIWRFFHESILLECLEFLKVNDYLLPIILTNLWPIAAIFPTFCYGKRQTRRTPVIPGTLSG